MGLPIDEIICISAKKGTNVKELLDEVVKQIPGPDGNIESPFKALIFDSKYDSFQGVIAYVRVVNGRVKPGDKVDLIVANSSFLVKGVGFFEPLMVSQSELQAGEIGYIATGIKEPQKVRVGDTISVERNPLPGYREVKPMVFVSVYPEDPDDFNLLEDSLSKLKLNDPALVFEAERKEYLGRGFLCGFLGSLHVEIVSERLFREFGLDLIISNPSLTYKIIDKNDKEFLVHSPGQWPDPGIIKSTKEPWVELEVMTPLKFVSPASDLLKSIRGEYLETKHFGSDKVLLKYNAPLREVIVNFYDNLKSLTQGFASVNYDVSGSSLEWREADLVKLDFLVAGRKEETFSKIVPRHLSLEEGRSFIKKLKKALPVQQFSVPLQAAIESKIIARETLSSKRKDVLAPLYGGDYTRKKKLLEKQKKGKKELKEKGRVNIPPKVFLEMFRS